MRGADPMNAPTDVIDVQAREVQAAPDTALVVSPHPLTPQGQRILDVRQAALLPGETLAGFLARHGVLEGQQWAVSLGGVGVPERHWRLVRPKHGHLVEARRVPGKQVLAVVALVVLSYFTFGAAGMAGGGFLGMTGAAGWIAAGAVYMAGSMVINKLLGPKTVKNDATSLAAASPTYAIQGGRNRARQFEPMALVLGQPYCVPDMAAQPYVYFENEQQYLWQVFHAGLNCASVTAVRIGETAVETYADVTLSYDGFDAGNTGLPALAASVDSIEGALLDAEGVSPGAWVTRTTSPDTVKIAIDLEAQLSSMNDKGKYQTAYLQVDCECRHVGAADWLPLAGGAFVMSNNGAKPLRRTFSYDMAKGQYEIRLRKRTANSTRSMDQNSVSWTSLKSYQPDSGNYGGQARVGVQIKATGQLSGAINELNWQATAKPIPYWNGAAWVTATHRGNGLSNPGALILMLARGVYDQSGRLVAGLGLADGLIDIESLKGFMVHCASRGFTFDYFLQETTSIGDLIDTIAAAGMGSRSWHTGRLGVIWFSDNQPIEGVVNMTTIKAKSFSVDYDTLATAEEIEFQYFDRERGNSWQSIRVLAPDVTVPSSTARQQLVGVSTEAQAAVLARFSMAQNIYQRKTVNCEVDLEHLVFRRGTLIALSHDVTQWGYGGRLQGVSVAGTTVTLALDDVVPSTSPSGLATRYVGLRLPGERGYRVFPVQAFTGEARQLTLAGAWPAGVPLPGASASNPAHDTVWIYDFKSTPGQKLRVADVSPQGNMEGARLALVPESAEFWNYVWNGTYQAPPSGSLLAQDLPTATDLKITVAQQRVGEAWSIELTATFTVLGNYGSAQLWAGADGNLPERIGADLYGGRVTWAVDRGQTWVIEIRPFDQLGRMGTKAATTYHVANASPESVGDFSVAIEADSVVAHWSVPSGLGAVDWSTTQLRTGLAWADALKLFEGRADSYRMGWLATGDHVFWAAHRNTAGDWSEPGSTSLAIAGPAQPIVQAEVLRNQVVLTWPDCAGSQPLRGYELRVGDTYAAAPVLGFVNALFYVRTEAEAGTRLYWVTAVDVAGNRGAPGYKEVTTLPAIEEAIGELTEGLDEAVADLLTINTGLAGNILDEAAQRGTALTALQNLVTEGDEQLAQEIALATARSVGYTRANLLYNGGFELGSDGWSGAGQGRIVDGDFGRCLTYVKFLTAAWKLYSTAAPAVPDAWYVMSCDVRYLSTTGVWHIGIEFVDTSLTILGSVESQAAGTRDFSNERDARLALQAQAPQGTTGVRVYLRWLQRTGNADIGIRYVKLERGNLPATGYTAEASDVGAVAALRTETSARVTAVEAEAAARQTLAVRVGAAEASLDEESSVRASETGALSVRYGIRMVAGGKASGFVMNNDGEQSDFVVLADRFAWATEVEGQVKYPVVFGTIDNVASFGFSGNMFLDGTLKARMIDAEQIYGDHIRGDEIEGRHIKADEIDTRHLKADSVKAGHIDVVSLDAISGVFGEIEIRPAAGKPGRLVCHDENDVLRVELGRLV